MKAYQCKVSIKDNKPPVWWRLFIPAGISFSALSLLLDELCGDGPRDDFRFEVFRLARVWEPSEERPLKAEYYYDAYSASHTAVDRLFALGRPIYCYSDKHPLKIEIEREDEAYPLTYPMLLKLRAEVDGQALYDLLAARFSFHGEVSAPLSRQELLSEEENGVLHIGCLSGEPVRDVTYLPSISTLWHELGDRLRGELDREEDPFSLRELLGTYTKEDLRGLARVHKLRNVNGKSAEALIKELVELLLDPAVIRKYFSILTDPEIDAFEKALTAGGEYRFPKGQAASFDTLSHFGYAFVAPMDGVVSIPSEIVKQYGELNTEAFHLNRRKLNWIMQCLNKIVPPYYGILPIRKFCRLCRRVEAPVIAADEVPFLLAQIPEEYTCCVVRNGEICSVNLAQSKPDYDYVVAVHGNKPWYIMREKEISELLQFGYPPHEPSYRRFKDYLRRTLQLPDPDVEEITAQIHLLMACDHDTERYFEVLGDYGMRLSRRRVKEVMKLFQDMYNNTPTFYNRGFTPNRMHEIGSM